MPPESNAKGDRRERELVNALDEAGFAVMRAPASGSATAREQPDVLAGNGGAFYAIEVKSSGGQPIYLSGEEVYDLVHVFANNFGAKPRIAVRFDREDWSFFRPGELHRTDGGNYRVKKERAVESGQSFEALVAEAEADADAAAEPDRDVAQVLRAVASGDLTVEDGVALLE